MGTKHTPGPWRAKNGYVFTGELDSHGLAQSGCYVANCCVGAIGGMDGPNAEHIARTANAHDDLLAACKLASDLLDDSDVRFAICDGPSGCGQQAAYHAAMNAIRKAIRAAEGGA